MLLTSHPVCDSLLQKPPKGLRQLLSKQEHCPICMFLSRGVGKLSGFQTTFLMPTGSALHFGREGYSAFQTGAASRQTWLSMRLTSGCLLGTGADWEERRDGHHTLPGKAASVDGREPPGGAVVKNPSAVQETQRTRVQSLGWEDALEEETATTAVSVPRESHGQRTWRATVRGVTGAQTRPSRVHAGPFCHLLSAYLFVSR